MQRVTRYELQARVNRINRTLGLPEKPYQSDTSNGIKGNPGVFILDGAYGGWALNRMAQDGGTGESCVLTRGTARDLYDRMGALLDGIAVAQGAK